MDWEAYYQYLAVDLGRAAETINCQRRAVGHMTRTGFRWETYLRDPEGAWAEGRRYLAAKRLSGKRFAVLPYGKVLNDLNKFLALERPPYAAIHWNLRKPKSGHPEAFTDAQLEALANYRYPANLYVEKRRRALIWLCRETGLRRSEIWRVDPANDLDPETSSLKVRDPAKDGKPRCIPLPPDAWSRKRPLQAWLIERCTNPSLSGRLWLNASRRPLSVAMLGRELWAIGDELGFTVSFNRFRRTRATLLKRQGIDLGTLQTLYGHQDPKSTRWYFEEQLEDLRRHLERARVPGYIRARKRPPPGLLADKVAATGVAVDAAPTETESSS